LNRRSRDREQIEKIMLHAQMLGIKCMSVLHQNVPMSPTFSGARALSWASSWALAVSYSSSVILRVLLFLGLAGEGARR
jgi:hypothetical protein